MLNGLMFTIPCQFLRFVSGFLFALRLENRAGQILWKSHEKCLRNQRKPAPQGSVKFCDTEQCDFDYRILLGLKSYKDGVYGVLSQFTADITIIYGQSCKRRHNVVPMLCVPSQHWASIVPQLHGPEVICRPGQDSACHHDLTPPMSW